MIYYNLAIIFYPIIFYSIMLYCIILAVHRPRDAGEGRLGHRGLPAPQREGRLGGEEAHYQYSYHNS